MYRIHSSQEKHHQKCIMSRQNNICLIIYVQVSWHIITNVYILIFISLYLYIHRLQRYSMYHVKKGLKERTLWYVKVGEKEEHIYRRLYLFCLLSLMLLHIKRTLLGRRWAHHEKEKKMFFDAQLKIFDLVYLCEHSQ